MQDTLIGTHDIWTMAAIIIGIAALSIVLEQKYKWASKITGAIISLLIAMALSNLKIIPIGSDFENIVMSYVVPLAIPMLLYRANLVKIGKESGKFLILFLISSVGTVLGCIVGVLLLGKYIPQVGTISAMMTGSYIGGSVNFASMAELFKASDSLSSSAVVADNMMMVFYIMFLIAMPTLKFFRSKFKTPYVDQIEKYGIDEEGQSQAAKFWGRKEISLKDIALNISIAFILVAISVFISNEINLIFKGDDVLALIMTGFFGNKYLILTTLTLAVATLFPKTLENINGSQEIGTFLICIFFVVIGIPASIMGIISNAPILLVFAAILIIVNMIVTFTATKLFGYSLEEGILASNANIGGPTTAAALAISKGWTAMVAPVMLVGTLGYVFGNYFGIFAAYIANLLT